MPGVKPEIVLLDAYKKGYAVGAFGVFNMESAQAVLLAAEEEKSPVFVQIGMTTRKYAMNVAQFVQFIKIMAGDLTVPVILHHDHCSAIELCKANIDAGFDSIMFDGSHFQFEDNIRLTREIADYAHRHGAFVEAELGSMPGFEDEVFNERSKYTDPEQVAEFVKQSGCDSLAVAVGTAHGGIKAEKDLEIDMERLKAIKDRIPGIPLVLHGGASLPLEYVQKINQYGGHLEIYRNASEMAVKQAVSCGICKVNIDVDNFYAFTAAIREHLFNNPHDYDPRKYLNPARSEFMKMVRHKMKNVLGSSGRADGLKL